MASTYPSSSSRQTKRLTKDQKSCVILIIGICCFLGALLLYIGSQDAYKLSTLSRGLCRVRSVNVKYTRYNYFPCWNITVMYENKIREEYMIESTGTRSDRWAWITARKYQVNETYPCYHSRNESSIIQWGWQWTQPTKLKAGVSFFSGLILIIVAVILLIVRQRFQTETKTVPEQTLLNSDQAIIVVHSQNTETKL